MSVVLIIALASVILLIIPVYMALYNANNNLDSIKNKTVGNGQHGSGRLATEKEIKENFKHVNYKVDAWRESGGDDDLPQGIVIVNFSERYN